MVSVHKSAGYTLFELAVVISIIFLFSALSLAAYGRFNDQKKLEAETKKFVEVLELAKKRVMAGDKPCSGYTGTYAVSWTPSTYTMTPSGCSAQYGFSYNVSFNLYNQSTAISILNTDSVIFEPFGLGATAKTVIFKNTASSRCRQVTIEASANISESEITCP